MAKARKIYTDEAGNTLWERQLKGRKQVYAKNRQGKVVDEEGIAKMMDKAGYMRPGFGEMTSWEATSDRGKRIMKRQKGFF